jgi:hypothetical protein
MPAFEDKVYIQIKSNDELYLQYKHAMLLFHFTAYKLSNTYSKIDTTKFGGIEMLDALWIVILGMAIIFIVLGVLLGMMTLLNKLLKPKKED